MAKNTHIQVLVSGPFAAPFDYIWPYQSIPEKGEVVLVPFGRRELPGIIVGCETAQIPTQKMKEVLSVLDNVILPETVLQFIKRAADYTLTPAGLFAKQVLSGPKLFAKSKPRYVYGLNPTNTTDLSPETITYLQQNITASAPVLKRIGGITPTQLKRYVENHTLIPYQYGMHPLALPKIAMSSAKLSATQKQIATTMGAALNSDHPSVYLLDGVTGSGKTETYMDVVAKAIQLHRQVLILLPEIALTPQTVKRFQDHFGFEPFIWHSQVSNAKKQQIWHATTKPDPLIIIGARSSLFLPLINLGLIVVDEEHDTSYKQEEGMIYNARDMAVLRGHTQTSTVILSSATPSLESIFNAQTDRYQAVHLPDRHGGASLPDVELIDLRQHKLKSTQWISPPLQDHITTTLQNKQQALLFLNRRGYAPLTLCRSCGHRFACPHCAAWLVSHQGRFGTSLDCHHCGYSKPQPNICPKCSAENSLAACGPGVERLTEEVHTLYPEARTLILSSDTLTNPDELAQALAQINRQKIDIIIGTQLIAKGHHFPGLTLVGVVDADMGLSGGDPRALERTYQLLHQVAGRAGREQLPGHVVIQTYAPESPLLQALKHHDRDAFIAAELEQRETTHLPPYGRLASLTLLSSNMHELQTVGAHLSRTRPNITDCQILGPAPPPLAMLRGKHRLRFILKTPRHLSPQKVIQQWLSNYKPPRSVKLQIDIDPVSFL